MKLMRIDRNDMLSPWFGMPEISMDDWFDEVSAKSGINMWEEGDNLFIQVAVPGMKESDIDVKVENGVLTVRAVKESKSEEKEKGVKVYSSTMKSSYYYSTALPSNVDTSAVSADLEDGVLMVSVKKSETAKPKKIIVKRKTKDK